MTQDNYTAAIEKVEEIAGTESLAQWELETCSGL